MIEEAVTYVRSLWPLGFTKPELEEALGHPVSLTELIKLRAIENTGVRRKHNGKFRFVVWRWKPYQLPLPLEKTDVREETSEA